MSAAEPLRRSVPTPRHDPPGKSSSQSTVDVIRPFVRGGTAFAGASTLELRGAGALAPEGLASTLPLDWQAEALAFVLSACRERRDAGADWLTLPPAALFGEKGAGRIHFARQLAHHAGLPYHVWNLSREKPDDAASPNAVALPPEPLLAMMSSGCANPIVVVVGVDEAPPPAIERLAEMVDARTNRRLVEHSVGATVDYSHVTWLVTPTSAGTMPVALERVLRPVHLFRLSLSNRRLATLGAIDEAVFNLGLAGVPAGVRLEDVMGPSVPVLFSDLYDRVHAAVQAHAPF